jgi:carbon storage regulator CsrA
MLCLSRRTHESIVITVPPSATARRIRVEVTGTTGDRVQLGFAADEDVRIMRSEIDGREGGRR